MYGEGISREGSLLDVAIEQGVVQKSGAWFAYGDERLGQGREKAKQFLKDEAEVRERIIAEVHDKLGLSPKDEDLASTEPENIAESPVEEPAGQAL